MISVLLQVCIIDKWYPCLEGEDQGFVAHALFQEIGTPWLQEANKIRMLQSSHRFQQTWKYSPMMACCYHLDVSKESPRLTQPSDTLQASVISGLSVIPSGFTEPRPTVQDCQGHVHLPYSSGYCMWQWLRTASIEELCHHSSFCVRSSSLY